jgi:HD-like signal output (HDOD) protein
MTSRIFEENPRATAIMNRVSEMAVLPHVVYKVLELSGSSDSSTTEMEEAIVVDPGFSSRLLSMANSAYYGLPKKVTSIREALMYLGFKSVRQLAMTVGVYDMFVGKNDKESLRKRAWWRHSVDTAVCAKWLAIRFGKVSADDAYTCGLLHYMGKSLLDRYGQEDYGKVEFLIEKGGDPLDCEQALYGCTHIDVGQMAARKWGFPEELVSGLDYRSLPWPDEPHGKYRAMVAVATQIAEITLAGAEHDGHNLCAWALELLEIPDDRQLECIEGGVKAIAAAAQMQV